MSNETLTCPVFDADNHLYGTQESFLRYLPEKRRGAINDKQIRFLEDYVPRRKNTAV